MQPISPRMLPHEAASTDCVDFYRSKRSPSPALEAQGLQPQWGRRAPLRPKASNHRGAGEDAANRPEDAPKRLQASIS